MKANDASFIVTVFVGHTTDDGKWKTINMRQHKVTMTTDWPKELVREIKSQAGKLTLELLESTEVEVEP